MSNVHPLRGDDGCDGKEDNAAADAWLVMALACSPGHCLHIKCAVFVKQIKVIYSSICGMEQHEHSAPATPPPPSMKGSVNVNFSLFGCVCVCVQHRKHTDAMAYG